MDDVGGGVDKLEYTRMKGNVDNWLLLSNLVQDSQQQQEGKRRKSIFKENCLEWDFSLQFSLYNPIAHSLTRSLSISLGVLLYVLKMMEFAYNFSSIEFLNALIHFYNNLLLYNYNRKWLLHMIFNNFHFPFAKREKTPKSSFDFLHALFMNFLIISFYTDTEWITDDFGTL